MRGKIIGLDTMLARERTQLEQPRFIIFKIVWIKSERPRGVGEPVFGNRAFDNRAVERRQRFAKRGRLARNPVEDPRCLAQLGKPRLAGLDQRAHCFKIFGDARATLHFGAPPREFLFLALDRCKRAQLGNRMLKKIAIALGIVERGARRDQRRLGAPHFGVCGGKRAQVNARKTIEQRAMPARIDQAAIIMLAVNLDELAANLAQQRCRHRLIVDPRAAPAIGLDAAPDDQRLAALDLNAILSEQRVQRCGNVKAC